jgi:hypothetical protein
MDDDREQVKGVTLEQAIQDEKASMYGTLGGSWWRGAFDAIKKVAERKSDPTNSEIAAVAMACFHINFDFKMALIKEGVSTDKTWQCIGGIVERESKSEGRDFSNFPLGVSRILFMLYLTRLMGAAGDVDHYIYAT